MTKYRAVKEIVDGVIFHSKKEAKRYNELKLLQRGGLITNLELQPKFPLIVNSAKICSYIGDFSYFEKDKRVIEDTKGFLTPEYRLKRKLLLALNPGMDHREL